MRLLCAILLSLCTLSVHAQGLMGAPGVVSSPSGVLPQKLQGIGIVQHLGAEIPQDVPFVDESGHTVSLRQYLHRGPVLLVPVYYTCPMLCSQILNGVVSALRPLKVVPGHEFQVVAFSFDPSDTPGTASVKRSFYMNSYSRHADPQGWHFVTGPPSSIQAMTNAIGFHYKYDPPTRMFLHASGIMILTPEGRLARYFYGVEYQPKDLQLGLVEASHRTIGSRADEILLFCYHYDPSTGKYGAVVMNVLRAAAVAALLTMGIGLALLWRRDLRQYRKEV